MVLYAPPVVPAMSAGKLRTAATVTCPLFVLLSVVLLAIALAGAPVLAFVLAAPCGLLLGVVRALGA